MNDLPHALILMGVSGCGKTSVGKQLSQRLHWPFYDGDDFHPKENVEKMARGIPLNDADRTPWLAILQKMISTHLVQGNSMILACSALKQTYRDQLTCGNQGAVFIHLRGDFDLINSRMHSRSGHYMKANMLRSQFKTLEEPEEAISVDIHQSVSDIVDQILNTLGLSYVEDSS